MNIRTQEPKLIFRAVFESQHAVACLKAVVLFWSLVVISGTVRFLGDCSAKKWHLSYRLKSVFDLSGVCVCVHTQGQP